MKLSTKFLKDYLDISIDTKTLAEDMTSIGNEYDAVFSLLQGTNLITGEVIECVNHPNSDHLHVCKVDIGNCILEIVCGAPNVRQGLKVIVAQNGSVLPSITIEKSSIRGVISNGMLCSLSELGLEHKYLSKYEIEGICELPKDTKIGIDPRKPLMMDDEIIDFELTSNRGDLLSILGLSYEIGALYNKKVKDINTEYDSIDKDIKTELNIQVETTNCNLFLAKKVMDVTIKESPLFIKNRLIASGIRPINNVVDISNYVMIETGQPLHFYDALKLGDTIKVRMGKENEELITLDNITRKIDVNDIVIADKNKAIGLAGVMGGLSTEIDINTKSIIIESAIFDSIKVRLTSKKILRSEASNRFEKGLDPNRTYTAINRACHLLQKYADAKIYNGIIEYNNTSLDDKIINITFDKIKSILGIHIDNNEVLSIFTRLGFKYELEESNIKVFVPTRRLDVNIPADLIEEIGRIYGVNKIVGKLPIMRSRPGHYDKFKRQLRHKLIGLGLNETLSYTLVSEKEFNMFNYNNYDSIRVNNPMTIEHEYLRQSIIPSLLMIYDYNKARNNKDLSLFEISKVFYQKNNDYHENTKIGILMTGKYDLSLNSKMVDFYTIKGVLEELFDYLGFNSRYYFDTSNLLSELHPYQSAMIKVDNTTIGFIGKVHPNITKDNIYVIELELEKIRSIKIKRIKYKEISKFPSVIKDVAFIIPNTITNEEVIKTIKKSAGKLLTNIEVFDVYMGENISNDAKSIAYNLTFNDSNNTLTDEVVVPLFNKIINDVTSTLGVQVRDR